MRYLLDTHIFIWWDSQPENLSAEILNICQDEANTIYLSVASAWEMQIKSQLGKLSLQMPLDEILEAQQRTNNLQILDVCLEHVLLLGKLKNHHKDPFDRLLIAQAIWEDTQIITADPIFKKYPAKVFWK
jgi:PIN domain nuclease of toxin-antitoxin system